MSFCASRFTRFVCSALRFISHEPRKKDRSSRDLFVPHCDSFPMNREKRHSFLIFTMPPNELVRSLIVLDSESSVFKLESSVVKLVSSVIELESSSIQIERYLIHLRIVN